MRAPKYWLIRMQPAAALLMPLHLPFGLQHVCRAVDLPTMREMPQAVPLVQLYQLQAYVEAACAVLP